MVCHVRDVKDPKCGTQNVRFEIRVSDSEIRKRSCGIRDSRNGLGMQCPWYGVLELMSVIPSMGAKFGILPNDKYMS
jgi:hypothetical protein